MLLGEVDLLDVFVLVFPPDLLFLLDVAGLDHKLLLRRLRLGEFVFLALLAQVVGGHGHGAWLRHRQR